MVQLQLHSLLRSLGLLKRLLELLAGLTQLFYLATAGELQLIQFVLVLTLHSVVFVAQP